VGTHYQGFPRLVEKMDFIASKINHHVIIQTGFTDYKPLNAEWFDFIEESAIHHYYKNADVVITHGGAGSILDCLKYSRSIIVVPRLKKYNEHIDDQQMDLAQALQMQGKVSTVYDVNKLKREIEIKLKPELGIKSKNKSNQELENVLNNENELNKNLPDFLKNYLNGTE
jgi:UDP-N-acetylglucosamine transferase subunit ALG13